jgi:phosphatidate cytidylyltransferase
MLKSRVITAVVLLIVLLLVLFSQSFPIFVVATAVFFAAAAWESFRLFGIRHSLAAAFVWVAVFLFIAFKGDAFGARLLFGACAAIWAVRLAPSLKVGLPPLEGLGNRLLNAIYGVAVLGCFVAIVALFNVSPLYLL